VNVQVRFAGVAGVACRRDPLSDGDALSARHADTALREMREFNPHAKTTENDMIASRMAGVFLRRIPRQ
jgi:hypothetical protein